MLLNEKIRICCGADSLEVVLSIDHRKDAMGQDSLNDAEGYGSLDMLRDVTAGRMRRVLTNLKIPWKRRLEGYT
jgi:hypothetical protein